MIDNASEVDENPIIEEIRRTREAMLAKHNGDFHALFAELQQDSEDRITSLRSTSTSTNFEKSTA